MPRQVWRWQVGKRGSDLCVIDRDRLEAGALMTLRNLITDIPGLRVGHAGDAKLGSGTTAVIFDAAVVASVDVRGGGPGTRETALLDPAQPAGRIGAIVLLG